MAQGCHSWPERWDWDNGIERKHGSQVEGMEASGERGANNRSGTPDLPRAERMLLGQWFLIF